LRKKIYISVFSFLLWFGTATAQPEAYFSADTLTGCGSLTVQFTDTSSGAGIISWDWDFNNDGTVDSNVENPSWTYAGPGSYSVRLVIGDGTDTDVLIKNDYIVVYQLPNAEFTSDDSIYYHSSFGVMFSDASSYVPGYSYTTTWNFGDGDSLVTDSSFVYHVFNHEGTFNVHLTIEDNHGCFDSISHTVTLTDLLKVPNVFTPNGDGINDEFIVVTNGETIFEFVVYSRWGMILFKSIGKQIIWDGRTSAGVELNTGTYFYTIRSVSNEEKYVKNSSLQLVRTKE